MAETLRRLLRGLALLLCAAARTALAGPDAQAILAASDAVRNPPHPFRLVTTLTEYRAGRQTEVSVLDVYSKADPASGQFRSLIRFVSPARDANKLMLKAGNELWFFDPASQASIRISPQQRLLGQAANGDVVTFNLARDYQATLAGEEDIPDGERQSRHCYRLQLQANKAEVTYHHIEVWIDTTSRRPVRARFYSESQRLLKTAYYRRYEQQLGVQRPTETVIIDGLDPQWVTVLRFSDWAEQEVPEAWLQRDFLPRFKPQ